MNYLEYGQRIAGLTEAVIGEKTAAKKYLTGVLQDLNSPEIKRWANNYDVNNVTKIEAKRAKVAKALEALIKEIE